MVLPRGTRVTPSVEEYQQMFGNSPFRVMERNKKKIIEFQLNNQSDNNQLVSEMQKTRKAIERNKPMRPTSSPKIDIPHEIFRNKNINWE